MKIPPGFLDANGKAAKGDFVLTKGDDQDEVKEFGTTSEGNITSSYVLISPGDILTLSFALRADIANHVDFVVDGILRNCRTRPTTKGFNSTFNKVVYQGWKSEKKRAAVKYSRMRVKERGTAKNTDSTRSNPPSSVGSLEIRLYRTDPAGSAEVAMSSDPEIPTSAHDDRAPAFDKCGEWYDCNSNLNFEGPPPSFQVEFFDHTEASKAKKDTILEDLPENSKLWATFVFHLRSADDLNQLGFNIPLDSTATDPLDRERVQKKGDNELQSDATSIEKPLVEEFTGSHNSTPKQTEVLGTKAVPRPAPILAPPTTMTGLLNALSSASDRSPEPAAATTVFENSKEAILLKQEAMGEFQSFEKIVEKKPVILRGVGGPGTSPAHRAFLEKASTLQSEDRSKISTQGDQTGLGEPNCPQPRPSNQQTIDVMFSPTKRGISQSRALAEEEPEMSQISTDQMKNVESQYINLQYNSLGSIKPVVPELNKSHYGSHNQTTLSRELSEASDSPTEVADPGDIARAVKSSLRDSQRSTQDSGSSHVSPFDQVGLGISNGPSLKIESTEYEPGNDTYKSPILGSSQYPTPRSNVGSPFYNTFTARAYRAPSVGSPSQPPRGHGQFRQATPGSFTTHSPKIRQQTPKKSPPSQTLQQSDLRPTSTFKRKSDYMTGNNTPEAGSPRMSSRASSVMSAEFEQDKAAAEARISTAERKREELRQRLDTALEFKREMDKVRDMNSRAAKVERENAEMEAELALIDEDNSMT